MTKSVDVIIPAYRPGKEFGKLISRLMEQKYPIETIFVMNTEEKYWDKSWEEMCPKLKVFHLKKEDFDHGGTRRKAAALSGADIMVFMTQDALPASRDLIGKLVEPICSIEKVGASYARQLPKEDCRFLER